MSVIDGNQMRGLIRDAAGDTLKQRDDGAWVASTKFTCKWRDVFSLMPRRYVAAHPDFPTLICDSVGVSKKKPGLAIISAVYIGLPTGSTTKDAGFDGENSEVIELVQSASQEPIETHPDFSTWAGTAADEIDGVKWNEDGSFHRFGAMDDGTNHPKMGIDSYLAPSLTVRRSYVQKSRPSSVAGIGEVEEPPGITGAGAREFLKTHIGWRRVGGLWQVEEEWLRAKAGSEWDEDLYD